MMRPRRLLHWHRWPPCRAVLFLLVLSLVPLGKTKSASALPPDKAPAETPAQSHAQSIAVQPPGARPRGEWLQLRGDRGLTGRATLPAGISKPAVLWKIRTSVPETLVHVRFSDESGMLEFPAEELEPAEFDTILSQWTTLPATDPDLDQPPPVAGTSIGKFLGDRQGLQKIEFDPAGYCKLMAREAGQWIEVWRSEKILDPMSGLQTLTGDFDGDGRLEVAFTPWTNLHVLDLETGRELASARFYQDDALGDGRPYGWFGAFDLDGDGRREFIIISDTQCYISVLGWKEDRLQFLWGHLFDRKSLRKDSELGVLVRPGVMPVQDVNGDGLPEIVLSVVRELPTKSEKLIEGEWSTLVLDGRSGRELFKLDGARLDALIDLDQDGASELLCTHLGGTEDDHSAGVSLYRVRERSMTRPWRLDGAAFPIQPVQRPPDYVHNGAALGLMTALTGPVQSGTRAAFFTSRVLDDVTAMVELTAWRAGDDGLPAALGSIVGVGAEPVATMAASPDAQGLLVRLRRLNDEPARVVFNHGQGRIVAQRYATMPPSVAVVGHLAPGERPSLVIQRPGERISAWQVANGQPEPRERWNVPGRGMHEGSDHRSGGALFTGVNLADLSGDARLAVIAGQRAPAGHARLVARDENGREIWHHDFESLDGAPPGFTLPGLAFWFLGRFTDPGRDDVLVAVKNHIATRLVLLDGRTGTEIWSQLAGGMYMSVFDYDGDGLDDALTTCWSEMHVLQGSTGRTLLLHPTNPPGIFGEKLWPTDAYSCAADLLGLGNKQFLYWPSYAARALLLSDGSLKWQNTDDRLFFGTPSVYPGIGDLDGDGTLDLISPGDHPSSAGHLCRCYDALSGKVRWSLPIERQGRIGSAVTMDLDGDQREECLYTVGNVLLAIGVKADGTRGEVLWEMTFPGDLGPLTLADMEDHGTARIFALCADGYLYCIGEREPMASP